MEFVFIRVHSWLAFFGCGRSTLSVSRAVLPRGLLLVAFVVVSALGTAWGQTVIEESFKDLNLTIPDNDPSGVAVVRTLNPAPPGSVILDVNVGLRLGGTGARNGDLYATLEHQSGYTVLLNRVGKSENSALGYEDPGLDVSFDDDASNGDIHLYRATLFGNHVTPVGQPLASWWSGNWAPDGRNVDPDLVTGTSPRRASLSSMRGLPVDGRWRLFVADVAPGGVSQLMEWRLQIRTTTQLKELTLDLQNATIRADAQSRVITIPVTVKGELSVAGRADTSFTEAVAGSGQLVKTGGGALVLSGANTFSGGINLEEGALVVGSDLAAGLGPIQLKGGSLAAKGGPRRLDNAVSLSGKIALAQGDRLELAGSVALAGRIPLSVENDTEISGDIQESAPGAGFIKSGNGKLTLSGVNTFSGGIALEEGTLAIGNDRALGTGPLSLKGGKVEVGGGSRKLPNPVKLGGSVGISGGITLTGDVTLEQLAALEIDGTTTLSGQLKEEKSGTGFAKKGNGALVLEGANTISGGVQIEEGTLSVSNLGGSATGSGPVEIGGKGALSGNGIIAGLVKLAGGAVLDPGASPGRLTTGSQSWPPGAALVWEINDAEGTEGADPGWDTLKINGTLTIDASAAEPFVVRLVSLGLNNAPGPATRFDPTKDYAWTIAHATEGVRGFSADGIVLDPSRFTKAQNGGTLRLEVRGNDLVLAFYGVRLPRIGHVALTASGLRIVVEAMAHRVYRIEMSDELVPGNWVLAETVRADALGKAEFEAFIQANRSVRFYRVVPP